MDRLKSRLHSSKVRIVIRCFSVFIEFCLNLRYIRLKPLSNKWKVNKCREYPSYKSYHYGGSYKCSKSSRDSGNKIGPEHFPWRPNIFHKFIETHSADSIDKSFNIILFFFGKCTDFLGETIRHFLEFWVFCDAFFHREKLYGSIVVKRTSRANLFAKESFFYIIHELVPVV